MIRAAHEGLGFVRHTLYKMSEPTQPRASAEKPAVELTGVTRVFGLMPAVVRVDLVVRQGEVVLVRGPNGSGKTTLQRLIATALSPTYGQGSVFGFDLVRDRQQIRERTEILTHRTRLYEDLTGEENLRFFCGLYGITDSGVGDVLERLGLGHEKGERVRGYSQGMRQRLTLGRVLLRNPNLVLLDEPFAGLDAEARTIVEEIILDTAKQGRTVILATHDPEGGATATRTLWMERGHLREPARTTS